MDQFEIFTDATADLPYGWCQQYHIQGVEMNLTIGSDDQSIRPDDADKECVAEGFFDKLREGVATTTTQATSYKYIEAFSPVLEKGKDILYCCFSSGMSGTWHNATMAAELLKERFPARVVRCVDTLSAAAGQGLMTLQASTLRNAGKSLEETVLWLEGHRQEMNHWFLVDDLEHLKRGGRVSPAAAFVGSKLQIKPILTIDREGKLVIAEKVRGRRQSMERLAELFRDNSGFEGVPPIVLLNHAGCRKDGEHLANMILQTAPTGTQVFVVPLSPVIGAHTGPDMLSVCFWGKPRRASH